MTLVGILGDVDGRIVPVARLRQVRIWGVTAELASVTHRSQAPRPATALTA